MRMRPSRATRAGQLLRLTKCRWRHFIDAVRRRKVLRWRHFIDIVHSGGNPTTHRVRREHIGAHS